MIQIIYSNKRVHSPNKSRMCVLALTFMPLVGQVYPKVPLRSPEEIAADDKVGKKGKNTEKIFSASKKNLKIYKCEIQDLRTEYRFITKKDGSNPPYDLWALLPETPMLLPLPSKFHVMEQVKRAVAWEYKLSDDRAIYKEEYLALINDSKKWIKFVFDNLSILEYASRKMLDQAANLGDAGLLNSAVSLSDITMAHMLNYLPWTYSVDPEQARWMKEDQAKKLRERQEEEALTRASNSRSSWAETENHRIEKIANGEPAPFRFRSLGKDNSLLVISSYASEWDAETINKIIGTIKRDIKRLGFQECVFLKPDKGAPLESDFETLKTIPAPELGVPALVVLPSACRVILHAKFRL